MPASHASGVRLNFVTIAATAFGIEFRQWGC